MLFNSLDFALFLPTVFLLYWFVARTDLRLQNVLVVAASYVFYGWWDWRFLLLIVFSTMVDHLVGLGLGKYQGIAQRKLLLWTSIVVNLGLLGFFKYFNFFLDNFSTAFSLFGASIHTGSLHIILPVGISFYTFQTLSYSIDVYHRRLEPTRDPIAFAAFVSFFPQLVAGPIERASHLLPQFAAPRAFDPVRAVDGLRQMLWGLFKKVVIADNCAVYADLIFDNSSEMSGSILVLGAMFFAFQIYGDFSGYSDIAIGTSRLFGFDLMRNFNFPYFSRDMAEFWRRWHISLSTWFRDHLYIPLGGSRGGRWMRVRNILIIFLVSGFWHGANWTFIAWGALNAIFFLPLMLTGRNRAELDTVAAGRLLPNGKEALQMAATFGLTTFAWIFFRAESIGHAASYIDGIFSASLFTTPYFPSIGKAFPIMLLVLFLLIMEWLGRTGHHALEEFGLTWSRPGRWAFYSCIIFLIGMFMPTGETPFIYFQF